MSKLLFDRLKFFISALSMVASIAILCPVDAHGLQTMENSGGTHISSSALVSGGVDVEVLLGNGSLSIGDLLTRTYIPLNNLQAADSREKADQGGLNDGLALHRVLELPEVSVGELIHLTQQRDYSLEDSLPAAPATPVQTPVDQPKLIVKAVAEPDNLDRSENKKVVDAREVAEVQQDSRLEGIIRTHRLTVTLTKDGLSVDPKVLQLENQLSEVDVQIDVLAAQQIGGSPPVELFVRDQGIAEWQEEHRKLLARAKGETELYIVNEGTMVIVPVVVQSDTGKWDLAVPEALFSLEGLVPEESTSAMYPEPAPVDNNDESSTGRVVLSLTESRQQAEKTLLEHEEKMTRFLPAAEKVDYTTLALQLIDERSVPDKGVIYPVRGARVHIVGTEFTTESDATGHVTVSDIPLGASFLITFDDASGQVWPGISRLTAAADLAGGVFRVKMARQFALETYSRIAGVTPNANLGSLCGHVLDSSQDSRPVTDLGVEIDVAAEGPYFFNRYGFMDRAVDGTGADGRFCFFNVDTGPAALSFVDGGQVFATVPVAVYGGRHREEVFDLGDEYELTTRLAAMASAHQQLGSDVREANSYWTVDMVDIIPLGTGTPMAQVDEGLLSSAERLLALDGRIAAFAQAAEFEPVLYTYDVTDEDTAVTPLIPRGFVEDMSLYAQVTHEPTLGVVVVEHGALEGEGEEAINIQLVDEIGREVGDGWYYSDRPTTKAIIFNVPPGEYALLVTSSNNYWLDAETVVVYSETVSYVRTGSRVRYRP